MKTFAWPLALAAIISASPVCAKPATTPAKPVPAKVKATVAQSTVQRSTHLYATNDGQALYLDRIFDPAIKVAGKRPVILFSFGGGWEGGTRNDKGFEHAFDPFLAMGYTVIAIDYRLGMKIAKARKEVTPDTATAMYLRAIDWSVEDIFDATAFTLQNADAWNIDKDQIVLLGGSSGATNSLMAEYNVANETELARTILPSGFRYAGVISMAGAFWMKANTTLTFKRPPAPIMFFHGAKDQLVTYDEIQAHFSGYGPVYYFRRFAGPETPKWFVDYPQGDHLIAGIPLVDSVNEMKSFLQKFVKERQKLSIHTIEEGQVSKTFGNAAKLAAPAEK